MVNRGKDSWNKAMLVDPQGNPSRPNKKMCSSTQENDVKDEVEAMSINDVRNPNTNEAVKKRNAKTFGAEVPKKNLQPSDEVVPEQTSKSFGQGSTEKNMRNTGTMSSRNKKATNAMSNSMNTDPSSGKRRKTPLEAFDVRAFFEENLYDIIDLEENRSGVREFENAVKRDE